RLHLPEDVVPGSPPGTLGSRCQALAERDEIQGSLDRLGFGSRAEHFASRVQLRLVQAIVLPLRRLVARALSRRPSGRPARSHDSPTPLRVRFVYIQMILAIHTAGKPHA